MIKTYQKPLPHDRTMARVPEVSASRPPTACKPSYHLSSLIVLLSRTTPVSMSVDCLNTSIKLDLQTILLPFEHSKHFQRLPNTVSKKKSNF